MQGTLSPGVLPGLLRDLYVGRKSGTLHFTHASERRSVRLHRGHIIHASTNVASDRLGDTLVRLGKLNPADHLRCEELLTREKKRLGQALQQLGLMTKQQVEEALALHVREVLISVFAWHEGAYGFEEQAELASDEEVAQGLSTGEMILEAVRQVTDPDVVRYALGDINRVLAQSTDPLLRFQKIMLSPVDGFLLSRVDGTTSAREVIDLAPVPPDEAEKSLFGLLCTGTVEYAPGPPKPKPKREATGRFRLKKDAGRIKPAEGAARPPAPPPPPPPTAEVEKEKAVKARRQEITEIADGLKTRTHFEVLGIPRASTEAQVKEAYFKLAKRFHPDTEHDPSLKDLAGQIEAVFIRIGEAYEVLRNPRTRASYEERLGPSRPVVTSGGPTVVVGASSPGTPQQHPSPAQPVAPASPPRPAAQPVPKDAATSPQAIENAVRQAEKALLQEKYWDVIQLIEPHLAEAKGKFKVRAQLAIAKAYLKNPNWRKRAEEELLRVVAADPASFEAYLLLGGIYKAMGLKARASSMYRKALELKPDSEEAAAALTELGGGPAEAPSPSPSSGSFLKKLFKKS
jgi:curved DNA-binding protein CbpA